jgi:hypothetical protein
MRSAHAPRKPSAGRIYSCDRFNAALKRRSSTCVSTTHHHRFCSHQTTYLKRGVPHSSRMRHVFSFRMPQAFCFHSSNVRSGLMERGLALLLASSLLVGCTKPGQPASDDAYRAKMRLVVDEAIRQTPDPLEKEEFRSGEVFVNLKGPADMTLMGVSVPVGNSKILVSFTLDHFQAHDVPVLAREALGDFRRAVNDQKSDRR